MKLLLAVFLSTSLLSAPALSSSGGKKLQFKVSGMSCTSCKNKVEKALNSIEGVKVISVNTAKGNAVIEVKEGTSLANEAIQKLLKEKAGFAASSFSIIQ